jgi:hypothetical protein
MTNKVQAQLPREQSEPCGGNSWHIGFIATTALLLAPLANAAELSLQPDARIGGAYNDNSRLNETGNENEITGGFLDLRVIGQRRTQTSFISIRPRLYFDRWDDSDEDSDDQYFDVFGMTRGQRGELRFTGNASNQQVRRGEDANTEFAESELDDDDKSTSGRIDRRRDRLRWRVKPEYAFAITERTRIGLGFEYIDVDYNNEQPGEALDYTDSTVAAFVERDPSERSRIRLTVFGSKYEADEISNDSKSFGGGLRYEKDVTETFTWFVAAGAQSTDVEAGEDNQLDQSQTSYLFTSGIAREWERTRFRAEISRSVDPSGTGFLKTRDGLRVNVRHQFRPRWYGSVRAYAFTEDSVDDTVDVNNRDYAQVQLGLGWQMARSWSVEGLYRYTYQDYDDTPGDAQSNFISLGLVYRPTKKIWSR